MNPKNKILSVFLTGLLGLAVSISNAQTSYIFETVQISPNSALAHSYRARLVSSGTLEKEFETDLNKFWIIYTAGLRKAMEENDDDRAADILKNMNDELRPLYEHLLSIAKTWKKMHNSMELKRIKSECVNNQFKSEALQLEADYNLKVRSEKNKSFHRAYLDLKRSIAKAY